MNHSPAPWKLGIERKEALHFPNFLHDATGKPLATIHGIQNNRTLAEINESDPGCQGLANGRLMAAAPELLEALENLIVWAIQQGLSVSTDQYKNSVKAMEKAKGMES